VSGGRERVAGAGEPVTRVDQHGTVLAVLAGDGQQDVTELFPCRGRAGEVRCRRGGGVEEGTVDDVPVGGGDRLDLAVTARMHRVELLDVVPLGGGDNAQGARLRTTQDAPPAGHLVGGRGAGQRLAGGVGVGDLKVGLGDFA
jgi:hypothetical protein